MPIGGTGQQLSSNLLVSLSLSIFPEPRLIEMDRHLSTDLPRPQGEQRRSYVGRRVVNTLEISVVRKKRAQHMWHSMAVFEALPARCKPILSTYLNKRINTLIEITYNTLYSFSIYAEQARGSTDDRATGLGLNLSVATASRDAFSLSWPRP